MNPPELKEHQLSEFINELREVAKRFGQAEQLRSRIAHVVAKYIKSADGSE